MILTHNTSELKSFSPAQLYKGKEWYIGYYAFNPETEKLERKKIKVNKIKSVREREAYAKELIILNRF